MAHEADDTPIPCSLIDELGRPQFGIYYRPLKTINLEDFDYRQVAPFPLNLVSRAAQNSIKRWQFMGFISDEIVVGMAVVDISYVSSVFAYAYVRGADELEDYSFLDVTNRNVLFSASSISGISEYVKGATRIRMDNSMEMGSRRAQASIRNELQVDIEMEEDGFTPLCAVTQNGLRGYNYCHKAAGVPVRGSVQFKGKSFELGYDNALGVLDWTAGCAARDTFWNWASGGGRLEDGRRLGINFVSGINDRGFTENAYWIAGRPVKVDTVHFEYNPDDVLRTPWRIVSNDQKVDLTFRADNERSENINLGLLISKFHQPFGHFEGTLEVDGKLQPVSFYGMVEEHQARW